MLAAALRRYGAALQRAPLRTNLMTAVPMMVAGDLCAQQLEASRHGEAGLAAVDPQRTLVMASYSGLIFTPLFFQLYKLQAISSCCRHCHFCCG